MLLTHTLRKYTQTMLMALAALSLASCNWMDEDLAECENTVRVHLVYDYNIQRADMFSDHVGEVRLFVIDDATNRVVRDTVVSNKHNDNAIALHPWSQTYYVDFKDLPTNHTYRFMAYALQKPEKETMSATGDKFHITAPAVGEDIKKLSVRLSRSANADADGRYTVKSPKCGLDTLWMTRTEKMKPLFVPAPNGKHQIVETRVEMIRDTKYMTVSLVQLEESMKADIHHEDFRLEVVATNGLLDWNNDVLIDTDPAQLCYVPFAQRTSEIIEGNGTPDEKVVERQAHYDISFSRLMHYTDNANFARNATLRLIRNSDNEVIANINLPHGLARARSKYELDNYGPQEYLDREYDYDVILYLRDGKFEGAFLRIVINATPWVIRMQSETLG